MKRTRPSPGTTWTFTIRPQTRFRRGAPETRRLPPSLNSPVHWSRRYCWAKLFKQEAWSCALEAGIPRLPRAKIEIVNAAVQTMDRDNLYTATKPIVDGLASVVLPERMTAKGPVALDDEEHLDLVCRSERVKHRKDESVTVTITALPPL